MHTIVSTHVRCALVLVASCLCAFSQSLCVSYDIRQAPDQVYSLDPVYGPGFSAATIGASQLTARNLSISTREHEIDGPGDFVFLGWPSEDHGGNPALDLNKYIEFTVTPTVRLDPKRLRYAFFSGMWSYMGGLNNLIVYASKDNFATQVVIHNSGLQMTSPFVANCPNDFSDDLTGLGTILPGQTLKFRFHGWNGDYGFIPSGFWNKGEDTNLLFEAELNTDVPPGILTNPTGGTFYIGQTATLTATASGVPAPAMQWRKNGTAIPGATLATLTLANGQSADSGAYSVVATNRAGSATSDTVQVEFVPDPRPSITRQPVALLVMENATAVFQVVAAGDAPLSYEWRKGGVPLSASTRITGVSTDTLTIAGAGEGDLGLYSVRIANASGEVLSNAARLTVVPTGVGAHQFGTPYNAGSIVTIGITIRHNGQVNSLGIELLLPEGWSYVSGSGEGEIRPTAGDVGALGWNYTAVPASPFTFYCTLRSPEGQSGACAFSTIVTMGFNSGSQISFLAAPDPLALPAAAPHTADTDRDWKIGLTELTRVIQLYNTRHGTTRSGCYKPAAASVDGFDPEPARPPAEPPGFSPFHNADTNSDGRIGVPELSRVIQLYNTRTGETRSGEYHVRRLDEPDSPDGFAPGR